MYPDTDKQLTYQTEDTVYFFTHALDPLSNWSAHAVELWGQIFPTVEHGFQWRKFAQSEPDIASAILRRQAPGQSFSLRKQLAMARCRPTGMNDEWVSWKNCCAPKQHNTKMSANVYVRPAAETLWKIHRSIRFGAVAHMVTAKT